MPLFLALALALSGPAQGGRVEGAQDWPEFRGPTGQGTSTATGLPVEWSPSKNVAWKVPVPGHGWSSPVLQGGRIFLTSAVPIEGSKDLSLAAYCLDAKDGETRWRTDVSRQDGAASPRIHERNSHASPTPVLDGGRLYVHFGHQGTACLDPDGKVLWRTESPKLDPEDGNGASAAVVDGALVFSQDGKDLAWVRALDRASGRELWRTDRKSQVKNRYSYCTPLVLTVKERRQVVLPGSGAVVSYDPKTGAEIWRVDYGQGYSVVPRPVFGHGLVYVCTGFDKPQLLAIRPDGEGDVTKTHVAWSTSRNVPLIASLVLAGDELYMVSDTGVASCLDARTGKEHWRERLGGQHWTSPLCADGKVYFQNVDGETFVVRAGPSFELLARNRLDGKTLASYAVSDGALFIRTDRHLYRIQERGP
jgi:outer membrane protein assembly factor BamB